MPFYGRQPERRPLEQPAQAVASIDGQDVEVLVTEWVRQWNDWWGLCRLPSGKVDLILGRTLRVDRVAAAIREDERLDDRGKRLLLALLAELRR